MGAFLKALVHLNLFFSSEREIKRRKKERSKEKRRERLPFRNIHNETGGRFQRHIEERLVQREKHIGDERRKEGIFLTRLYFLRRGAESKNSKVRAVSRYIETAHQVSSNATAVISNSPVRFTVIKQQKRESISLCCFLRKRLSRKEEKKRRRRGEEGEEGGEGGKKERKVGRREELGKWNKRKLRYAFRSIRIDNDCT